MDRRRRGVADVLRRISLLQAALLLLTLAVVSVSLVAYRNADRRAEDREESLLALESLRSSVLSAETNLRGYLLIGNADLKEDVDADLGRVQSTARGLDDDDLAAGLADIIATMSEWRAEFAAPLIEFYESGDFTAALELSHSGQGKLRVDRVRATVDELVGVVQRDLADRRARSEDIGRYGIAVAAAAVLGLALTAFLARRRLDRSVGDPLRELATTADRLGAGDLGARTTAAGVAEIDRVAFAFNRMAGQVESTVTDLRAVDRLKSEFVSVVSHELRTPLTSIRGSLGLLATGAMGEMPPDAASMLGIAVSNTDRLVRLINDILDLERIEAGRETMDVRPCSIEQVVRDAASGLTGAAEAAGVHLSVKAMDATVRADPDRLVQALTNLAGNAIKFSDPGDTVTIESAVEGHGVVVRIVDEGRGIPPDMLETVFDRFRQVDASDAREKGGTGLGLAITKSIVDRHGGRIEVSSTVGEGSCFTIVLPRLSGDGRTPLPAGDRDVVLVVEDEADIREILSTELAAAGLAVLGAATADEALELCRHSPPAALVLDVRLAEGDGYDVVRALRQDDRLRSLPTIVYTVVDLRPEEREALRLGDTRFVIKGTEASGNVAAEVLDALGARVRSR